MTNFNFSTILLKFIATTALVILGISYFQLIQFSSVLSWDTDYKYLYSLAKQTVLHQDPYLPSHFFEKTLQVNSRIINLNPPFVGLLIAPFGFTHYTLSFWLWSLQSLFFTSLSTYLILRTLFQTQKTVFLGLMSILLTCIYFPVFANIKSGQIGAIVFFFVTLGWLSYRKEKPGLTGIFLGIAFSIKLFIGLFLWMFFLRKQWRALNLFLLTTLVCSLISWLAFNPHVYINYWHIFEQVQWYSSSWNASLLGFFSRLFGYQEEQNFVWIHLPQLTPILYGLCTIGLLGLEMHFFTRLSLQTSYGYSQRQHANITKSIATRDLHFAYTIIAMLLISPLGWIYYFPLLFIPIAIIFYWNNRITQEPRYIHLLLAVALFCSSFPYPLLKPYQITQYQDIFLYSNIYFYALCILITLVFNLQKKLTIQSVTSSHSNVFELTSLFLTALLPSFLGILHLTHLIIAMK